MHNQDYIFMLELYQNSFGQFTLPKTAYLCFAVLLFTLCLKQVVLAPVFLRSPSP